MILSGETGRTTALCATLVALLALLSLAGCGSSGGTEESTAAQAKPVTKKEVVHRAEVFCTHGYKAQAKAVEAYAAKHGIEWRAPNQAEREELNREVVLRFVEEKIAFWKALPVPPGDGPQIQRIIESMERGLEEAKRHPGVLAAPTAEHPEPFLETRELTGKYGPWICGQA